MLSVVSALRWMKEIPGISVFFWIAVKCTIIFCSRGLHESVSCNPIEPQLRALT